MFDKKEGIQEGSLLNPQDAVYYAVDEELKWKTYASRGGHRIQWRNIQNSADSHLLTREWRYVEGDRVVIKSDNVKLIIEAWNQVWS